MKPLSELPRRRRQARRQRRRVGVVMIGAAAVVIAAVGAAVLGGSSGHETARPVPRVTTTTSPLPVGVPVPIAPGPVAPVISRIPTTNRVMFFTIDDGFVRDPAAVAFIRDHHIPVTMFLLPAPVRADPSFFLSLAATGASVQDHTVHHRSLTTLSGYRQVREICGSLDLLQTTFGRRPWLFRPPYGALNAATKFAVRRCGLEAIVTWQGTMNGGVLRLQHPGPLAPGDIVLLHFRTDLRRNLEVLLRAATQAGLRPAPLEQYLPAP